MLGASTGSCHPCVAASWHTGIGCDLGLELPFEGAIVFALRATGTCWRKDLRGEAMITSAGSSYPKRVANLSRRVRGLQ